MPVGQLEYALILRIAQSNPWIGAQAQRRLKVRTSQEKPCAVQIEEIMRGPCKLATAFLVCTALRIADWLSNNEP